MKALKIAVTGAMGRMGQALIRYICAHEGYELLGAVERHDHPDLAKDIGLLLLGRPLEVLLENDLRNVILGAQAVIDFTLPEAALRHAEWTAPRGMPLVIGTTGVSAEQRARIETLAEQAPIVLAPNMSIGVNLLFHLARRAAQVLDEEYDVEIVETHHRNKVDAPSGTALRRASGTARSRPSFSTTAGTDRSACANTAASACTRCAAATWSASTTCISSARARR
jgi:4-hydroxy-tetrahydrodipicolinate reductase